MKHVGVNIVTGFLGSGKTTLLKHALEEDLRDDRVAVIVNEIGDIGLDGRTITGFDYVEKVVEFSGGCICCSIDEARFGLAVQELIETVAPSVIVIESTGLADPAPMIERVRRCGLALDAVVTVVDATSVGAALRRGRIARRQIALADFLVVSKVDLARPPQLDRLRRRLRRMNRRALLRESCHGAGAGDLLFATSVGRWRRREASRETGAAQGAGGLAADGFEAFSCRRPGPVRREPFEAFLRALPKTVFRAKGFVRIAENPWICLFNVTCGRYELNWVKLEDDIGGVQAVFVGQDLGRVRDRIERDLSACCGNG